MQTYKELKPFTVIRESITWKFLQIIIPDNSMPPSKHPQGTYGGSIVSEFCAFGVQWSRLFQWIRTVSDLFWNLTGESVESFLQIIRDVGPTVFSRTRREDRSTEVRFTIHAYILDMRNRILLVIIWLRMYPDVAVLSGMFMISPTMVQRDIYGCFFHYYGIIEGLHISCGLRWLTAGNYFLELLP
jgi:hypothetical protein